MKKILALILIITMSLISYVYSEKNLINIIASYCETYEIIEDDNSYQVVKINNEKYENIFELLDIEMVSKKEVSGRIIVEGYTSKLNNNLIINNRKVNIQISLDNDSLIIGSPLIKNSF
ncbi:MAG: hypothetical protein ACI4PF_04140 [Christensenellales bacterium]